MSNDEQMLSDVFTSYAIDNLFWSLIYLDSAIFATPLMDGAKNKLLSLNQTYKTILTSIYPLDWCKELILAMDEYNQLFVIYVERLIQGSNQIENVKQKWKENGQRIATLLSEMNPYWKSAEWSAMINHETDLLETIAINMKTRNYATFINVAPICRRLAIDMSNYMCSGIIKSSSINK